MFNFIFNPASVVDPSLTTVGFSLPLIAQLAVHKTLLTLSSELSFWTLVVPSMSAQESLTIRTTTLRPSPTTFQSFKPPQLSFSIPTFKQSPWDRPRLEVVSTLSWLDGDQLQLSVLDQFPTIFNNSAPQPWPTLTVAHVSLPQMLPTFLITKSVAWPQLEKELAVGIQAVHWLLETNRSVPFHGESHVPVAVPMFMTVFPTSEHGSLTQSLKLNWQQKQIDIKNKIKCFNCGKNWVIHQKGNLCEKIF